MKFQQWPKRDPDKNYFKVPNEVFHIGLSYPEISIYCYLLSIEDRETYQCYPSYKTIGKALGMSENTVSKYVRSLEEKGLIRTEPTMVRSKDGRPLNGNLLYTICPIQAAVESFYERQLRQLEEDAARQRVTERLRQSRRSVFLSNICQRDIFSPIQVERQLGHHPKVMSKLCHTQMFAAKEVEGVLKRRWST